VNVRNQASAQLISKGELRLESHCNFIRPLADDGHGPSLPAEPPKVRKVISCMSGSVGQQAVFLHICFAVTDWAFTKAYTAAPSIDCMLKRRSPAALPPFSCSKVETMMAQISSKNLQPPRMAKPQQNHSNQALSQKGAISQCCNPKPSCGRLRCKVLKMDSLQ